MENEHNFAELMQFSNELVFPSVGKKIHSHCNRYERIREPLQNMVDSLVKSIYRLAGSKSNDRTQSLPLLFSCLKRLKNP